MQHMLPLRKTDEATGTVYLPQSFARHGNDEALQLAFSTKNELCRVVYNEEADDIRISSDLWEKLHIPHEEQVHIFRNEGTLHIGPIVGIFTAGFTGQDLRPIGQRTRLFSDFLSVSSDIGAFCFVFGYHNIDWENALVEGFFYREGSWQQITAPLPDVIYDRLPNRRTEQLEQLQQIKQRLQDDYLIPWFNPGFFDKWDIQQRQQTDDRSVPYLPETYLNPSLEKIESLLDSYGRVFLKPTKGSLGIGIHEVEKSEDNHGYYCRFHNGKENRLRHFQTVSALMKQQFPKNKIDRLLVQEGIDLQKRGGRSFDFRIHTNKNTSGDWVISAIAVKVAGPESVTTHVNYGGEVKTVEEVFKNVQSRRNILEKLKRAVLDMSAVIEETTEGIVAELGFDLGVDQDENVWLFEANAKPGRHIFAHPKLKDADLATRKLPMSYAVFLAEKVVNEPAAVYA